MGSVPMHKNMRITARGKQDTLLIIFLVNTRVVMATNKAAVAMLNRKYQHGMECVFDKLDCGAVT